MAYNTYNPSEFVPCNDSRRPKRTFQQNNPRPNKWKTNNSVTKVFTSNMNTTPLPDGQRGSVHRDGRHFKLVFAKGIKYDETCDWIKEELGFTRNNIDSVMFKSLRLYEIEAKSEAIAMRVKDKIADLRARGKLSYDVAIEEYAPALTPLTVMGVPKIFPDSALQRLITEKLKTKIVRVSADTDKKHQWYTGKRLYFVDTVTLKAANIPDSVSWNNGEWVFYLSYPGQEKTCRKCGETGHYAKTCRTEVVPTPSDDDFDEEASEEGEDHKEDEIYSSDGEENPNKRQHSQSPNKHEPGKKSTFAADDALHENYTPTQERRVYHVTLPAGKTAPQVSIRKMCDYCGERETVMEPTNGFYISYCEKCDPLSLRATSKCFENACAVNKTWNKLPLDKSRVTCANPECASIKYICSCNNYHSVNAKNTQYRCDICQECVDPPLN